MTCEFHLTPDMMAAMYDYMRTTKPFSWWKLPPSESVEFHVTKHKLIVGDHVINEKGVHVIRASTSNIGSTDELARVMAHEMVHAHCDRKGVRAEHGSAFQICADKVCKFHGFDRKRF